MNVLILQPIRPSNPPALRARANALLDRLPAANPGMTFAICQDDTTIAIPPHPSQYLRHATVRNYMIDRYLTPEHDLVLWIDSDLIDYPADLPTLLHTANPGGITAPLALLDRFDNRFYDIGGFVECGHSARMSYPWFDQTGDLIDLESVGCCYLAPAALYQAGVRYSPPPCDAWFAAGARRMEFRVEHNSVMADARALGYRICCLTTARVVHAWLPDYGLMPN